MIRVILPAHLRALANADGEIALEVSHPVTLSAVLDMLEIQYPALCGTIRDHVTKKRRPLVRFYACETDYSHQSPDVQLPDDIVAGKEPLIILGAIAGG